jgi:phosphoribosyl-AMP cyclohydrolase
LVDTTINAYRQQVINIHAHRQQVINVEQNNLPITQHTKSPSKPWHKKLMKKAVVTFQSYLPLTAQQILFVDNEIKKYIANAPTIVEEEKEKIFEKKAQKYAESLANTHPTKKQKDWLSVIHQHKEHQDTILFFEQVNRSIEICLLSMAYMNAKALPPFLRTEKQSWLIPTMENWAQGQRNLRKRKKRDLMQSQQEAVSSEMPEFKQIEWQPIMQQNEQQITENNYDQIQLEEEEKEEDVEL